MTAPMFERVALIGLGLIGSSLSHAMRRAGVARTIVGHAQSEKTRDTALRLLDGAPPPQVVDLARLDYISSAGLGVLLKTQKRAVAAGKGLRLINPNKHIYDILRYAGFDRIFDVASPNP